MYTVERRNIEIKGSKTSMSTMGRGYELSQETVTRPGVWCVLKDGDVIAECATEDVANGIEEALSHGHSI